MSRQTVKHGVGRPRHLYDVTPDAQDLFPSTYDALASGLLSAIGAVGGDELIEEPLKSLEEEFASRFVRVHRNSLVAVDDTFRRTTSGPLMLEKIKAHNLQYELRLQPDGEQWQLFFYDPSGARVEVDYAKTEHQV